MKYKIVEEVKGNGISTFKIYQKGFFFWSCIQKNYGYVQIDATYPTKESALEALDKYCSNQVVKTNVTEVIK